MGKEKDDRPEVTVAAMEVLLGQKDKQIKVLSDQVDRLSAERLAIMAKMHLEYAAFHKELSGLRMQISEMLTAQLQALSPAQNKPPEKEKDLPSEPTGC